MKLYDFEKYYLSLIAYKALLFSKKVFSYKLAQYLGIAVWFFASIMVTGLIILHFFIGVNVFLEKVHLEKYRIEKIPGINSDLDLRPYFKK